MRETHTAGEIRRSQMVQIYGPGAIINLKYQRASISVVMCDLSMWEYKSTALSTLTKDQKFADDIQNKTLKMSWPSVATGPVPDTALPMAALANKKKSFKKK